MKDALGMFLKIIFAIFFIPVCYAMSVSFWNELSALGELRPFFVWGVGLYILLQLFFYTPQGIFQIGQSVFGGIFKPVPTLAAVVPLFVPIIPTVFLLAAYVAAGFFDQQEAKGYLVFLGGFSAAMHLILSAHAEFEEDNSDLKPHYLFLFSLTLIFNLLILALLLELNFEAYSFQRFLFAAYEMASHTYGSIYQQLFGVS